MTKVKIMRLSGLLALAAVLIVSISAPARAEPKPTIWDWWPWHYSNLNFSKRYLEDGKTPMHSQWAFDQWTPETWTNDRDNDSNKVMQGFYSAGFITGETHEDGVPLIDTGRGIPVVEVGPNFLRLSDKDKRRVIMYVDSVWHATDTKGALFINYKHWGKPIGIYTKAEGLQLQ